MHLNVLSTNVTSYMTHIIYSVFSIILVHLLLRSFHKQKQNKMFSKINKPIDVFLKFNNNKHLL